jgi:hypothetical protein
MYSFSWEKNLKLINERRISFDEVIAAIENGHLLDILEHPNKNRYENQKIYVINIKQYIYLVPFIVAVDGTIILKTIIPSRKAKKKYAKELE